MSFRDRRKLGVTFFSVLKAAKELGNDEEFSVSSEREFAEKILEKITAKNLPQLSNEGIDLESILEFIMNMLPLILKLIDLFS